MTTSLPLRRPCAILLGILSLGLVAATTPADTVRARIASYRELGAAYKGVNDSLRGSELQTVMLGQYARQIRNASRAQYSLFPAGSGASAGVPNKAKPEIWSNPNGFKAAQDAFSRQADALVIAVQLGDAARIRATARTLGGTCKGCHDSFRQPQD